MKTLGVIEPRRPIMPEMLPLTITEPGSYYLVQDTLAANGGITVDADFVTIDLMGFALRGGPGIGINVNSGRLGTTVRNGTVANWSSHGISLYQRASVHDVIALNNGGIGISTQGHSVIVNCISDSNASHGITSGDESVVRESRATGNIENGIWIEGGQVIHCVADANGKNGIRVRTSTYVRGCLVQYNDNNHINGKAGIWVEGDDNRIEENHVVRNNFGLDIDGDNNVIVKNTFWSNDSQNVAIDPGATGNILDLATSTATAGPWSNFIR